ncbi:hypothetical protein DEU56DRAFT_92311 [Suillus clintonianus]|uniref:uncharacterized protein n=1 Tax=Suillus clintonianus TaxID=1904413 RepID=UPI001B85F7F0|nr:uncharacterized protein DEU56DRAFT_92311 [Suillus clintonianus]KAG2121728.1 hypothetical protein DEU56DRAFT_92311 [Suillus clintonianus]
MIHNCVDWDTIPLRFLTISYGNKRVVTRKGPTSKVREFKSLQSFARRKFSIQDRPFSSLRFRTTCNLSLSPLSYFKDDSAFEVDEEAWEEEGLMDLVCCLEVYSEEVMPGPSSRSAGVDGESGQDSLQPEEEHGDAQVHKQDRDFGEREEGEGKCRYSDVTEDRDNVEAQSEQEQEKEAEQEGEEQDLTGEKELTEETEQTEEEEVESALRTKHSGRRRRVIVSDDEDSPKALDHSSMLAEDLQQKHISPVVDDPQPSPPTAKSRTSAVRAQEIPHVPEYIDAERPIKKEKEIPLVHRVRVSSVAGSSQGGRLGAPIRAGRPIKRGPVSAGRSASRPEATQESEPAPELAHTKLVISIQHKPSAQHAQFSTKPRTRVGKVLIGACKSFRLDANVAQLYLVVVTQNDQGFKEEDYFLCDRDETVETAVVGVEGRAEFMIRMPEDPAM